MRQEDGQTYCSLSWCGASFGAPFHSRVFKVVGKPLRLRYPSMIEYHDIVPRSAGGDPEDLDNQAPLCIDCHALHHFTDFGRLTFDDDGTVERADGKTGRLVLGDRTHLDAL